MSETDSIQELVIASLRQPTIWDVKDGRKFAALPQADGGYKLEQITLENAADVLMPKVVKQNVQLQSSTSMVDYINRFKNEHTVLFADIKTDTIVAVIDYHNAAVKTDVTAETEKAAPDVGFVPPRLALHRATLKLPKAVEWETWNNSSRNGRLSSHLDFATFIEENAQDIILPVGADLLELVRDLEVADNVQFGSSIRMGDITKVEYWKENDVRIKGGVVFPKELILRMPVYFGEASVNITAFMRRKITEGHLALGYALSRAENVRQDEFHRIVDQIKEGVEGLTTVYGTPA